MTAHSAAHSANSVTGYGVPEFAEFAEFGRWPCTWANSVTGYGVPEFGRWPCA
jgi:hypothetical protein